MKRIEKKLGEILVAKGVIKAASLDDALAEQKLTKEFLGAILVRKRYINEGDLLKALAEQFAIPVMSLSNTYIDWTLAKSFNPSVILQDKCFPVKRDEWTVTVAIVNPLDVWALKRAEEQSRGLTTKFVLVSIADMEEATGRYRQFMRGTISGML